MKRQGGIGDDCKGIIHEPRSIGCVICGQGAVKEDGGTKGRDMEKMKRMARYLVGRERMRVEFKYQENQGR